MAAGPPRTAFEEQLLQQFAEQKRQEDAARSLPLLRGSQDVADEEEEVQEEEVQEEDELGACFPDAVDTGQEVQALKRGLLDGKCVQIHGLEGRARPLGEKFLLDVNGLRGLAEWDEEQENYLVHSFKDFSVRVPEANLREAERPKDAFDVAWPRTGSQGARELFLRGLAESLCKGYCLVQMHTSDEAMDKLEETARDRPGFSCLRVEAEETYLGCSDQAWKSLWLQNSAPEAEANMAIAEALQGSPMGELLPLGVMLRLPVGSTELDQRLKRRPISDEDVRHGLVEAHLDFLQRRRLCLLRPLSVDGSTVDLWPRMLAEGEDVAEPIRVQVPRGQVLLFRHDALQFAVQPDAEDALLLQSWLLEGPQRLLLHNLEGGWKGMEEVFGGPPQARSQQVHVMSCMCRFPGNARQLDRQNLVFLGASDLHVKVPLVRFDIDTYYDPDGGQFAPEGRTIIQHSAFLQDEEVQGFDNSFFGIEERTASLMAPAQRMVMEVSFEGLAMGGCTRKSLRGSPLMIVVGEGVSGLDWDWQPGLRKDPYAWLKANSHPGLSTANRLAYTLGTKGPSFQVDCACSSELVAASYIHVALRHRSDDAIRTGMAMAGQVMVTPWPFVGGSMAGLHGDLGRCATFNATANGFVRGEGSGGLVLSAREEPEVVQDRLAVYLSSYINQDGRSATLTAPNGMSQAICIASSMREAGLEPSDLCTSETHGTATAIGDPIEVGSLVRVFRDHKRSLAVTAGKSNVGHTEPVAGGYSLLKTILSMTRSVMAPNVHFRVLSKNISSFAFVGGAFRGFFPSEACDHIVSDYAIGGVTSFGYGGTNCRSEIWAPGRRVRDPVAQANQGRRGIRIDRFSTGKSIYPRALRHLDCITVSCPACLGPMCWLCSEALPCNGSGEKHHCSMVREDGASYDVCSNCYTGSYSIGSVVGEPLDPECRVFMKSTASSWAEEEMEEVSPGIYVGLILLGEARAEQFHLLLEGEGGRAIFPIARKADQSARVLGPEHNIEDLNWFIDGFQEGAPVGAVYQVKLEWGTTRRSVSWRAIDVGEFQRAMLGGTGDEHFYSIAREANDWKPEKMQRAEDDSDFWEWNGALSTGEELFRFLRDGDHRQVIYPQQARSGGTDCPIMGPDEDAGERGWLIKGEERDQVSVRLRVVDGCTTISLKGPGSTKKSWQSTRRPPEERYLLTGSWNGWRMEPLLRDEDFQSLHRLRFRLGAAGRGNFQIATGPGECTRLYPAIAHGRPGREELCVGDNPDGLCWEAVGPPGQTMEIQLDLGAHNLRDIVSCKLVL